VNYYTLRDSSSGGNYQLRNWVLEGSKNSSDWTVLRTHTADTSITSQGMSAGWAVQSEEFYRYIRVRVTGHDLSNRYYFLFCCGIELYGSIIDLE